MYSLPLLKGKGFVVYILVTVQCTVYSLMYSSPMYKGRTCCWQCYVCTMYSVQFNVQFTCVKREGLVVDIVVTVQCTVYSLMYTLPVLQGKDLLLTLSWLYNVQFTCATREGLVVDIVVTVQCTVYSLMYSLPVLQGKD